MPAVQNVLVCCTFLSNSAKIGFDGQSQGLDQVPMEKTIETVVGVTGEQVSKGGFANAALSEQNDFLIEGRSRNNVWHTI